MSLSFARGTRSRSALFFRINHIPFFIYLSLSLRGTRDENPGNDPPLLL